MSLVATFSVRYFCPPFRLFVADVFVYLWWMTQHFSTHAFCPLVGSCPPVCATLPPVCVCPHWGGTRLTTNDNSLLRHAVSSKVYSRFKATTAGDDTSLLKSTEKGFSCVCDNHTIIVLEKEVHRAVKCVNIRKEAALICFVSGYVHFSRVALLKNSLYKFSPMVLASIIDKKVF